MCVIGMLTSLSLSVTLVSAGPTSATASANGSIAFSSIEPEPSDAAGQIPAADAQTARDPSLFWLAPRSGSGDRNSVSFASLASAVTLHRAGKHSAALTLLSSHRLPDTSAASYNAYYLAQTHLKLGNPDMARRQFAALAAQRPQGYLMEAAMVGEAEAAAATGNYGAAQRVYERLLKTNPMAPDHVWFRLARTARAAGDRASAVAAFTQIDGQFPLSRFVPEAMAALDALGALEQLAPGNARYQSELRRADALLDTKRYEEAGALFERLLPHAIGGERVRLEVRRAICHYHMKRYAAVRVALNRYRDGTAMQAEVRFFDLMSARMLGEHGSFEQDAIALIDTFPDSAWAEETLNTLATHYIQRDRAGEADTAFRRLLDVFPNGRFAERAAWKVGWRAVRSGKDAEAVRVFERAAATFPRSTYRPAYLYWSARSRQVLGDHQSAADLYTLVGTDYRHSYYGRLAHAASGRQGVPVRVSLTSAPLNPTTEPLPPTSMLIRGLLSAGLYNEAVNEIRYARHHWGDSPVLEATLGWVEHQRGDLLAGARTVKRAYPQYVSIAGEGLPTELSATIFPLGYWALIREHAERVSLDPFLLAALVAQESGFIPDIRSPAKAVGLMQLMPDTAQQYARTLALPSYSPARLVHPATNVQLGTTYFANLMREFGDVHLALASYNAGETRVRRWLKERPDLAPDEFIDDIPFPETQDYVKKILGMAEDYRRIYSGQLATPSDPNRAVPSLASRRSAALVPAQSTPRSARPAKAVKGGPPRTEAAKKPAAVAPKARPQTGTTRRTTTTEPAKPSRPK